MKTPLCALAVMLALFPAGLCATRTTAIETRVASRDAGPVSSLEVYDVSDLNEGLRDGTPTVDVFVHIAEGSSASWPMMREQIRDAQRIYAAVGVQLRVVGARRVRIPSDWLALEPSEQFTGTVPDPALSENDLYRYLDQAQPALSPKAQRVFTEILRGSPFDPRVLQIVCLGSVNFPIHLRDAATGRWSIQLVPTSADSFPPYAMMDRMPPSLRGVITINPKGPVLPPKVLAHEMGHKLMNVSHEGAGVCPENAVRGTDDLMLYGPGTTIPSGEAGRWQLERLELSPFLYRMVAGKRVWNRDFAEDGRYADPLYGRYAMSGPCRNR